MASPRFADVEESADPGRPSPRVLSLLRVVLLPLARLAHRPTIEGLDKLPPGPFLLVANHSGAMGTSEIFSFVALYLERFGLDRPLAGFAHPFGFRVWPLKHLLRGLGAIPSTYAAAESALGRGVPLLVFPGGEYEVTRPIWQANRVDFRRRLGFLKLARKAGVPIVPMGFRGSHYSAPILWRSDWLLPNLFVYPRVFGLKRYPLTLLGVLLAAAAVIFLPGLGAWRFLVAFLCAGSPVALLPWVPWRIRIRVGDPLPAGELFGDACRDEDLPAALARVEGAVQALVADGPRT